MKKIIVVLLFLVQASDILAQKEDYIWLSGYDSHAGYDSADHHYFGINRLDFNYSPRHVSFDSTININFNNTNVCYSDTSGQILFYSNGVEICNKWDSVIQNSRYMNEGYLLDNSSSVARIYGYPYPNALLALAKPLSNQQYFFLHCFVDTTVGITNYYPIKLLSTYLSMTDNSGQGRVLYRDSLILHDTIASSITACRHANGRDWWILCQELNSNCYYRILLDTGGIHLLSKNCLGVSAPYADSTGGDVGLGCFSPDGTKYANLHYLSGLSLYNFDRCSGALSDPHNYPLPQIFDSAWYSYSTAFSPNSRFLYASITEYVLQFDTWAANPLSHLDTVGRYDGFRDPFGSYYGVSQLAPDGKIYIASGNSEGNYGVIDSPDQQGSACHFTPHGLPLAAYHHGPPNNPNYRLGRLIGSPCDTLSGLMEVNTSQLDIRVYPNPALDFFIVDYGLADWNRHDRLELKVTDIAGRVVYSSELSRFSAVHTVSTTSLASGLYLVEILDIYGRVLSVRKVVKEE